MRFKLLLLSFVIFSPVRHIFLQQKFMQVTKVIDGDTFWVVDVTGKQVKIRLIGIDAPEPRNVFKRREQYFGKESSQYMKNLIGGKKVRLEYDAGRLDRYGRTLAYAYLVDGTFINARMVQEGYAVVMTVPPNVKFADYFLKLQRKARKQHRGLWKKTSF